MATIEKNILMTKKQGNDIIIEYPATRKECIVDFPTTMPPSNHMHTKNQVGLDNVDNTSDLDKPISRAVQTALDKKSDKSDVENLKIRLDNHIAASPSQLGSGDAVFKLIWSGSMRTDIDSIIITVDPSWYRTHSGLEVLTLGINIHRTPTTGSPFSESPRLIFVNVYRDKMGYGDVIYSRGGVVASYVHETLWGATFEGSAVSIDVSTLCYVSRVAGLDTLCIADCFAGSYCYITDVYALIPN